jgi:hypothetical protein
VWYWSGSTSAKDQPMLSLINKVIDVFSSSDWSHCLLRSGDMVMRRLPGRWEYRGMTLEEAEVIFMWQATK